MAQAESDPERNGSVGPAWHARSPEAALEGLDATTAGLTGPEAARRLEAYGPNRLPAGRRQTLLQRFLAQFRNLLIYVLLGSAAVSLWLGHPIDAAVILLVVLANAVVGVVQEGRAERALEAIRDMVSPQAAVLRDGRRTRIPVEELVPGDILLLEPGDRIGADARLLRASGLRIDEAILTGESVPVDKTTAAGDEAAPVGDRLCMTFSGTMVVAGQGLGLVTATGRHSELGRISTLLGRVETLTTPLLAQMDRFGRQLTGVILAASALVFGFAILARGYGLDEAFMTVVGIAVAAIPEGLPAVMTITLAIGVQRMARRKAIIRRLPAVETLGSVSIICSDKTGTLTRNEMMVRQVLTPAGAYDVSGNGYSPDGRIAPSREDLSEEFSAQFLAALVLCNDSDVHRAGEDWRVEGDPMEGALLVLAAKAGLAVPELRAARTRLAEIPFDARHRLMATLNGGDDGRPSIFVKGAPERIIDLCTLEDDPQGPRPLAGEAWHAAAEAMAADGLRVLALAWKPADAPELDFHALESGLRLLALVGLLDPPREETMGAIAECGSAGIGVKMITGDHAETASAIARALGIPHAAAVCRGAEVDAMDGAALAERAGQTAVFARTSPEHKLRIVEALQSRRQIVAMTGDGVNDAPALKRADVGVAMGRKGTETAKEAAQIVLADDNFASIVAAVREGRTVYDNLKKVIAWTLPTNGGEALAIIASLLLGLTLPLSPLQILWINLVTAACLGLTLAFEPTEADVMRRPPRRPSEPILSGFLVWRVAFVSCLVLLFVGGVFAWARDGGRDLETARTLATNTIVVLEIFYLFSIRYLRSTSLTWRGLMGTPAVLIGVGATVALQLLFTYLPWMNLLFASRPLSWLEGAIAIGLGIVFFAILEIEKLMRRAVRRRQA